MYESLGSVALKSGERAEIGLVTAPEPDDPRGVSPLLGHKGGAWTEHIEHALHEALDGLETRFYIASREGRAVANVMTVEYAGAGILGHVWTIHEHRRQGLCEAIFAQLQPHFLARGGLRLTLGTGFDSAPYWIYHRHGFRSIVANTGFMQWTPAEDFAQRWYAPAATRVVPYAWRHWPALAQLLADDFGDGLAALGMESFGPRNFEGYGVQLHVACRDRADTSMMVLETERGAAMGFALLAPDKRWPGVYNLDLHAHPNFAGDLPKLAASLTWPEAKVTCCLPAAAAARREAVEAAGFEAEAILTDHLPNGDDVIMFQTTIRR
jgi:hypothetical protein